jgi:hypothetical protein
VGRSFVIICKPVCATNSFSIDVLAFGANMLALKSPCTHMSSPSLMLLTMSANISYASCLSCDDFDTSNMYTLSTCSRLYMLDIVIHGQVNINTRLININT